MEVIYVNRVYFVFFVLYYFRLGLMTAGSLTHRLLIPMTTFQKGEKLF